ncbi:carbon-nitrogen hydrolase [Teratosphaeria destructans]|uniref:nitrilase n=1 Tax=Teratosphaeria destructans TaxID=418781 RepID=A0A9W7T0N3_9PEZI|nr:carbon-nitrogen hydrolase [Teratosphaeria destructans]
MASSAKPPSTLRVAVTQHEPVWLDLDQTVDKTIRIVREAAEAGAKLVVFPECWIPGYPAWIWSRPVDFDLGTRYVENCLSINSSQMKRIQDAAATYCINIGLGFSERDGNSVYIAQAVIDETGAIQMQRRKMKPTHMERTIFGDASGDCLASVVELPPAGGVKVGSLSCWEHIQPLLKYYTFSQNEQVHIAAWPPLDPFVQGSPGLWSMSVEGCRNLSQTYAAESQSFVLHCTTVLTDAGIESMRTAGSPIMGSAIAGSSAIIGPDGRILSATETPNEQLIIADLDLSLVTKTKTFADASGHYSRPDMLWLGADPTVKPVVRISKQTA